MLGIAQCGSIPCTTSLHSSRRKAMPDLVGSTSPDLSMALNEANNDNTDVSGSLHASLGSDEVFLEEEEGDDLPLYRDWWLIEWVSSFLTAHHDDWWLMQLTNYKCGDVVLHTWIWLTTMWMSSWLHDSVYWLWLLYCSIIISSDTDNTDSLHSDIDTPHHMNSLATHLSSADDGLKARPDIARPEWVSE